MVGDLIRYATVLGSVIGVVMMAIVMSRRWRSLSGQAQRSRYVALLFYMITFAYGSSESLAENVPFGLRHVIAFVTTLSMLIALYLTHKESWTRED